MWIHDWGPTEFFRIALFQNNLEGYYRVNFALMQYHKYSLSEIENMMPWEREVYTTFLIQYLEELKQKQEAAKNK